MAATAPGRGHIHRCARETGAVREGDGGGPEDGRDRGPGGVAADGGGAGGARGRVGGSPGTEKQIRSGNKSGEDRILIGGGGRG